MSEFSTLNALGGLRPVPQPAQDDTAAPKPPVQEEGGAVSGGSSARGDRVSISAAARAFAGRETPTPLPPQARDALQGVSVSRDGGTFSISREIVRANGDSLSRERSVSVDPDGQRISRERSVTVADGRSVSVSGSVQRTENGFERSLTVTGLNGEQTTRTVSQNVSGEDGITRAVVLEGGTYDVQRNVQVRRGEQGVFTSVDVDVSRNVADGGTVDSAG